MADAGIVELVTAGDEEAALEALRAQPDLAVSRNADGVSVTCLAVYRRMGRLVEALRAALPELDVHEACCVGDVERVDALLDADPALLEAVSPDGFRPLGYAAFFGHGALLRRLVERGADVGTPSDNPMHVCALHSAAATPNEDDAAAFAALLLARGADPNVRQRGGFTPLHEAALRGHLPLAQALLDAGADPRLADDAGQTPRDLALSKQRAAVATLLEAAETATR